MKKFFLCMIFIFCASSQAFCKSGAILAFQPAYNNMRFYMYRPDNVPKNFYATYDGYLIYRNTKGVWFYASAEQNNIVRTNYILGSVVPSTLNIKPLNSEISSVSPILGSNKVVETPPQTETQSQIKIQAAYIPPSTGAIYNPAVFSPNAENFTQNTNFLAVGKWQNSIDRIGIIDRPATPAAWKGDYPEVIYIWNGEKWTQINSNVKNSAAIKILRRKLYDITKEISRVNKLTWTENDSIVLKEYASQWGYEWLGTISTGRGDL